ncbi:pectate lyase [Natronoflexus pectinivorans]|uniref:Pectate lyase n=1 Tax=Natronoflexus pectinivorans TaxID=682526 RepID=A0A4R2G7J0_9BACT|nr:pectate lyase [Natronoflexus pectinivorans]TCO03630.1 pectate lyase [Natronoflexus pectinivorans]
MKKLFFLLPATLLLIFISCSKESESEKNDDEIIGFPTPDRSSIPAFPGAEGGGMYTTGGAGGRVYTVTSLEDTFEAGTLRHAVMQNEPRTIVFAVSGEIKLTRNLRITNGNLTIAGQTAPGDGITIRDYTVMVDADNVIIRFLRFRLGDETATEDDAIWGRRRKNVIIDHCSMSWSTDECASFYDNENFTMQWCLIAESLNESVHDKGAHGYGGLWGGNNASFHNNLLAHHKSRNPRFYGVRDGILSERAEMINNVIYNWGDNSAYGGEDGEYNIINNYYKAGPATNSHRSRIFEAYRGTDYGRFYISGNYVDGYHNVSENNWLGVDLKHGGSLDNLKVENPFEIYPVTIRSAEEAYELVLEHAGMSLSRDAVDNRIIEEVRNGTATFGGSWGSNSGIIDTQEDVGGWPQLSTADAPIDTDGDGIPDEWEIANGLDPNDPTDGRRYILSPKYTNLEVYLNSIVYEKIGFGGTGTE